MIDVQGVSKFFPVLNTDGTAEGMTALLSVSLSIKMGSIVSFLGASGCGKSTLLEIIAGLQAPSEGIVSIDGNRVLETLPSTRDEIRAYKKRYRFLPPFVNALWKDTKKHDVAMIFQDYAVFPWMTTLQNVTFALKLVGIPRGERKALAIMHLRKVGLATSANKYPSQLSGGMRQRLALARAFSVNPKIILMDEPFAAVDALTRERLQDDLLAIASGTDTTIVMVTHDVAEAVYVSDEIFIFSSNPGQVRNHFSLSIPRPRQRNNLELAALTDRVVSILHYDTFQECDYSI